MLDLPLVVAAFVAGFLMFLAPCTLPIVPGYVAFVAGGTRARVLVNALGFVAGFSIVFIVLGVFAGSLGALLFPYRGFVIQLTGALLVLFGLVMLGRWRVPGLSGQWQVRCAWVGRLARRRVWVATLLGALFALGWSPCIGPILGSVLFLAGASGTALQGALLLALFSLGLALPFVAVAAGLERAQLLLPQWGRVAGVVSQAAALLLVVVGLLMLTGYTAQFAGVMWGPLLQYL